MMNTRTPLLWQRLCGLMVCVTLNTWAQPAAPDKAESGADQTHQALLSEAPVAPAWTYSLALRTEIANLSHPGSMKLRPSLGLRYGRWRIGQTDGTYWHRFGQVLQDSNLTYDVRQDTKWSVSLSGSLINLDKDSHFDAFKAGRKTLRAKAGLDYRLPNRWSVGLIVTQDVFMRGDGTTFSPTLTYRQPLTDHSTLMLSQSVTWGSASHWQTQQNLNPEGITHQGAGWGSLGTQLAYRHQLSRHWGVFSQLSAQRTLQPIFSSSLYSTPEWTYSGQLGVVYFDH
jgi:outer membrane scaffolding protein for murein synthesis (MipA/OmpV family)